MNSIAFLKWQSDGGKRSQYVRDVTDYLIDHLDITNGDAQGLVEAHWHVVVNCINHPKKIGPDDCARLIEIVSTVPDISE